VHLGIHGDSELRRRVPARHAVNYTTTVGPSPAIADPSAAGAAGRGNAARQECRSLLIFVRNAEYDASLFGRLVSARYERVETLGRIRKTLA